MCKNANICGLWMGAWPWQESGGSQRSRQKHQHQQQPELTLYVWRLLLENGNNISLFRCCWERVRACILVSVCALVFKMKVICQLITQLVVVPASSNARAQAQVISFGISSLLAFEWSHYEGGDGGGGEGVAGSRQQPACLQSLATTKFAFFSCSPRGMCRFCAAVYCQRWSKCF